MPVLDGEDRVVGMVLREFKDTGNYIRSFLVLDFSDHKLRVFPEEAEFAKDLSKFAVDAELNCQYITKVGAASTRPKVLNCFEIATTQGTFFFSVDSTEEREEWVESIRKSSMRQGSARQVVSSLQQKQKQDVSYQTKVVGGVVHKIPISSGDADITTTAGSSSSEADQRHGLGSRGATPSYQHLSGRRTRGFPRIIRAGHGIKLGAVMKNWKKRFFVLTEISLGYYKTIEELDPIKTISVGEIVSVSHSKEIPGKEHLFEVVTPSRTFFVQVDSDADLHSWVKAFNSLLRTIRSSQPPPTSQVRDLDLEDSDEEPGTLV